jgi:hypothetical protein
VITAAPPTPWTRPQLGLATIAHVIGSAAIVAALVGSRSATTLSDQISWLNLAVFGLVITAATHGIFLMTCRRAVGRRRRRIVPDVVVYPPTSDVRADAESWHWTPGTRRAHHAGCALLTGRPAQPVGAADIRARALERCELCG